jgi:hypothetical protein
MTHKRPYLTPSQGSVLQDYIASNNDVVVRDVPGTDCILITFTSRASKTIKRMVTRRGRIINA